MAQNVVGTNGVARGLDVRWLPAFRVTALPPLRGGQLRHAMKKHGLGEADLNYLTIYEELSLLA
jgi:hypothetical protein